MTSQGIAVTTMRSDRIGQPGRLSALSVAVAERRAPTATVVFLCPMGFGLRNVLHSGLIDDLRERGVEPIVLRGGPDADVVADGTGDVHVEPMLSASMTKRVRGKAASDALLRASFNRRHHIASYRIFNRWLRRDDPVRQHVRNALIELLSVAGSCRPLLDWQMDRQERAIRRTRDLAPIRRHLERLGPSLVVSTSCIAAAELPYTLAARDLGIPTLACILSFDNLTSRGTIPRFDAYAVWNERMREQLLRFYPDRDAARVHITGTPQFDFHCRDEFRRDRARTLAQLGLREGDRYLVYAANSALFTPTEPELVSAFARRCAEVSRLAAHRIVVRLHPLDDYRRWETLPDLGGRVVVVHPWEGPHPTGPDAQVALVNTLRHADVCLNMASTMSLDAAVVGTPVICVAFAGRRDTSEDRFHRDVYSSEHYRPIIASGGVRVAHAMDQLVAEVIAYVNDPARDGAARQRLVAQECGQVDGHAAERIGALIARLAQERVNA